MKKKAHIIKMKKKILSNVFQLQVQIKIKILIWIMYHHPKDKKIEIKRKEGNKGKVNKKIKENNGDNQDKK